MFTGIINPKDTKAECARASRKATVPVAIPLKYNGFILTGETTADGTCRSLVVYDFDGEADLEAITGAIPWLGITLHVRTGSGGLHFYLHTSPTPAGHVPFTVESASWQVNPGWKDKLKGFDTRGEGGIIFAPGCRFKEHGFNEYTIISEHHKIITITQAEHLHLINTFTTGEHLSKNPRKTRKATGLDTLLKTARPARLATPSNIDIVRDRIRGVVSIKSIHGPWDGDRAPCHLGNTSSPSIQYYPGTDSWFCHKCQDGGDVIALHAALHGMSYKEAWHDLIQRYSIDTRAPQ